jgi:hypothetical protein
LRAAWLAGQTTHLDSVVSHVESEIREPNFRAQLRSSALAETCDYPCGVWAAHYRNLKELKVSCAYGLALRKLRQDKTNPNWFHTCSIWFELFGMVRELGRFCLSGMLLEELPHHVRRLDFVRRLMMVQITKRAGDQEVSIHATPLKMPQWHIVRRQPPGLDPQICLR